MKKLLGISCLLFLVSLLSVGMSYRNQQQHDVELDSYRAQVEQLLSEIDLRRDALSGATQQIEVLKKEIQLSISKNVLLEAQSLALQDQIDPDYKALENNLRRSIAAEYEQAAQHSDNSRTPKLALLRELTALEPQEFGELMTLNAQYAPFLNSLNVDDYRLEIIVSALSDMMRQQGQARQELVMQIQTEAFSQSANGGPFSVGAEFEQKMRDINSNESQLEALSYSLTDEELSVYSEFLSNTASLGAFSTSTFATSDTAILSDMPMAVFSGQLIQASPSSGSIIQMIEVPDTPNN